jgi:hypothetical protein
MVVEMPSCPKCGAAPENIQEYIGGMGVFTCSLCSNIWDDIDRREVIEEEEEEDG